MELLILVATLFSTFNVILLIGLIYLYARIVMKTHAGYSAGLLIFAVPYSSTTLSPSSATP